jgi:hypothetical protein
MSYNKKIVAKPLKKYCKVCHDAGKPESEYTSHFIRESPDPKSAVICPTLLGLECRFCFQSGHTIKYCKVLEARDKETDKRNRAAAHHTAPKQPNPQQKQQKVEYISICFN